MFFKRSILKIPEHIAIIMDGNGRWAKKRFLPRVAGHAKGVKRAHEIVEHCSSLGVKIITLFAFGRENWQRPQEEVSFLMHLLSEQIDKEFFKFHDKNVKITFIGDRSRLNTHLIDKINKIEHATINNTQLKLNIALDYSGKYDIIQAINKMREAKIEGDITEEIFNKFLLSRPDPDPELLIRTSGEMRLSNFMLWQCAYSEMYFVDTLWPDFKTSELDKAIQWFNNRERRFGKTSEQLETAIQ